MWMCLDLTVELLRSDKTSCDSSWQEREEETESDRKAM